MTVLRVRLADAVFSLELMKRLAFQIKIKDKAQALIPKAKAPPHATGLHSPSAPATRSPFSRCADRILSAEARRRPRTSLSFDSTQIIHLVGSICHGLTPLR